MNIQEIINQATIRSKVPTIANIFSSTDETALEFLGYANMMANEIATDFEWQALKSDHSFTTIKSQTASLPCDFDYMITHYIYDTSRNEVIGNETDDQALTSQITGTINQSTIQYRLQGDEIRFSNVIDAGRELVFTYKSKDFVCTNRVYGQVFTKDDSEFLLDDELLILGIVYQRSLGLGFPDTALREAQYRAKMNKAQGKDAGKRAFNILGADDTYSPKTTDANWNRY